MLPLRSLSLCLSLRLPLVLYVSVSLFSHIFSYVSLSLHWTLLSLLTLLLVYSISSFPFFFFLPTHSFTFIDSVFRLFPNAISPMESRVKRKKMSCYIQYKKNVLSFFFLVFPSLFCLPEYRSILFCLPLSRGGAALRRRDGGKHPTCCPESCLR